MNPASHDEIVGVIGDVKDLVVERLALTGASIDEIAEAWRMVARRSEALSCAPRLAELRAILEELRAEPDPLPS